MLLADAVAKGRQSDSSVVLEPVVAAPSAKLRDHNLDLLRAIAILAVLGFHLPFGESSYLIVLVKRQGWLGVDLFFVLSGYLIGRIYFRECNASHSVHLMRFWRRRWLRTIPPYLGLVGLFTVSNWVRHTGKTVDWYYFLFLQNYWSPTIEKMPFTWSLCVEEHFYFIFPLLGIVLGRRQHLFPYVLLIGLVAGWICRSLDWGNLQNTHMRLDGLIYGVSLAYLQIYDTKRFAALRTWCQRSIGWLLSLFLILPLLFPERLSEARLTISVAIFAIWLCAWAGQPPVRFSRLRLTYWVATMSYSAYLVHGYGYEVAKRVLGFPESWAFAPVYLLFAAAFTMLFYMGVERPALLLRDWVEWLCSRPMTDVAQ